VASSAHQLYDPIGFEMAEIFYFVVWPANLHIIDGLMVAQAKVDAGVIRCQIAVGRSGIAPQLTDKKRPFDRSLEKWIARAISSFPVPLSP